MTQSGWLPAKRNATFSLMFERYLQWLLHRSFDNVWIRRNACALPASGYVAVANHSSWWDGFVAYLLHTTSSSAPFSIMMDDAQLRRFPFFRMGGAFSISTRSNREAREAVVYAADQARSGAGVWIFPEGAFSDGGLLPFNSAFVHVARRAGVPVVPVALRYAMLEKQRPEVFVEIGQAISIPGGCAAAETEATVRVALMGLDHHIARHDRSAFDPSWQRRAGIDDVSSSIVASFRQ